MNELLSFRVSRWRRVGVRFAGSWRILGVVSAFRDPARRPLRGGALTPGCLTAGPRPG